MAKRDHRDDLRGRSKYAWLLTFAIILMLVLAGRLFGLQYFKHSYYSQYAEKNQLQRERIVSPRGLIRDRNHTVLVDNVPRFDIVMPWRLDREADVRRTVEYLNSYVPLDTARIFERFGRWKKRNRGIPFPIVQNASKFMISFVRENYDRFPKLRVKTNARRRYRGREFAAHLLGFVGEVNEEFLFDPSHRDYYPGDMVGKSGIESAYEKYLRGDDGQRVVAVNASGTVLGELKELLQPPVPGLDVTLTIDAELQEQLEGLLGPLGSAAAAVMNVEDGSLLAVTSLPQFDPNKFAVGITQTEWDLLNGAEDKPLFNRFLRAGYPPGSTLKVVSAYTILKNRIVDPGKLIVFCTGAHRFGNRSFGCWKAAGHGYMNLHSGFVQSCDSYFYKVGEVLDIDDLAEACRQFGLGVETGLDLPNEIQGLVPDRAYYDRRFGRGKWTQGLVLNDIIGQGEFLVSIMQMCRVAAAVANGGYLVRPHVIKVIGQGEGAVQDVYPKRKIKQLSKPMLRQLRRAMEDVVHAEHGTGRASRVTGLRSAGKTGTAQNPHGEDHAWFIGYAPADDPEIAVAIVVENAGHGGSIAAPVAREIYQRYFSPPTDSVVTGLGAASPAPSRRADEN